MYFYFYAHHLKLYLNRNDSIEILLHHLVNTDGTVSIVKVKS
jgi:hypothetical protein